jgi:uncharacterized membrane protein
MEQGWDPEVKRFFQKIIWTIFSGLLWMTVTATSGIYLRLATGEGRPLISVIIFYLAAISSLFLLLRYYYKLWRK